MELINGLLYPTLMAYVGYLFGNRTKRVEVDIEKTKELNVVLSNMLNSWHYLLRLSETISIYEEKESELIFPKEYLPFISLHSDLLKDSCFADLDESVSMLKRYDAISYFELEGIGKRYDYLKTNYTIPFLKSTNPTEFGLNINRQFIDKLLNEIEEHLRSTSKQISKETYKRIEKKIEYLETRDAKDLINEFNKSFYEFIIDNMPENEEKPSYEEFLKSCAESDMQDIFKSQFELIAKTGIAAVTELVMSNPSLTLEEVADRLGHNYTI